MLSLGIYKYITRTHHNKWKWKNENSVIFYRTLILDQSRYFINISVEIFF